MATNIGPKIGIEGEASYRKQMNQIIAQAKELDSEMKLVTSSFNKETSAEEKNTKKKEVLNKQIKNQQERIKALSTELEKTAKQYGENDTRTIKLRTSLNNANTALNKMQSELNETEKELAQTGRETQTTTLKMNSFDNAMLKVGDKLPAIGTAAKSLATTMAKTLAVAATAAATAILAGVTAMTKWGVEAGRYADEILTLSTVTHLSTDTLQELAYMADLTDTSLDTITGALSRNVRSMRDARKGTEETVKAYETLGVEVVDANGELRDGETVFWELIDALGKVDNETERDALAMTLLGRSAQDLNPLIRAGSKGMKNFAKEAHDAGAIMDKDVLDQLGEMDDSLQRLKQTAGASKRALGATLAPAIKGFADDTAGAFGKFNKAVNDADGDADKLRTAFSGLVKDLTRTVTDNLPEFAGMVGDMINALIQGIGENPDKIKEAAHVLLTSLVNGISDNAYGISYGAADIIGALIGDLTTTDNLQKLLDGGGDIVMGLMNGLSDHASDILMAIPNLLQAFANDLKDQQKRQEFVDSATNFMHSFANAMIDSMDTMVDIVPDLAVAVTETLTDPEVIMAFANASGSCTMAFWDGFIRNLPKALTMVNGYNLLGGNVDKGVADGLKDDTQTKDAAGKIADDIIGEITGKGPNAKSKTSYKDAGKGVADEVGEGLGEDEMITISVADIEKIIKEPFTNGRLFSTLRTSGGHLMQGLIEGINSKSRDLKKAVQDMADIINANLHFSRPDEGPLRDYEKWMPDMVSGLAEGIRANTWRLRDAAAGLGAGIAGGVNPTGRSYVNNVGGISVNVYGAEGQSVDALADRVMDRINITLQNQGRVWA